MANAVKEAAHTVLVPVSSSEELRRLISIAGRISKDFSTVVYPLLVENDFDVKISEKLLKRIVGQNYGLSSLRPITLAGSEQEDAILAIEAGLAESPVKSQFAHPRQGSSQLVQPLFESHASVAVSTSNDAQLLEPGNPQIIQSSNVGSTLAPQSESVVCIGEGFAPVAASLYCMLRDLVPTFVADFQGLERVVRERVTGIGFLTIIANPSEIDIHVLYRISGLMSDASGYPNGRIALLTALRPSTLVRNIVFSNLITQLGCKRKESLFVFETSAESVTSSEGMTIFTKATPDLRQHLNESLDANHYDLFGFLGHGFFCRLSLGRPQGAFCPVAFEERSSVPNDAKLDASAAHLPDCAYRGHACSYKQHIKMGGSTPETISPLVVFADGCCTASFDQWHDSSFNIALNFLESGALAYIGSCKLKFGTEMESLLFEHLISKGEGLGEVNRMLNAFMSFVGEGRPYILLGDPHLAFESTDDPLSLDGLVSACPDGPKVTSSRNVIEFAWKMTPKDREELLSHKRRAAIPTKGIRTPQYAVLPGETPGQVLVFVSSIHGLRGKEEIAITPSLVTPEAEAPTREIAPDSLENLNRLPFLGVNSVRLDGARKDFLNHLLSLSKKHLGSNALLLVDDETNQRILSKVDNMNHQLMATVMPKLKQNPKITLDELYGETLTHYESYDLSESCLYCGASIVARFFHDPVGASKGRISGECLTCGPIIDMPIEMADGIPVSIEGPAAVAAGNEFTVRVRLQNTSDCSQRIAFSLSIAGDEDTLSDSVIPQRGGDTVAAGESKVYEVPLVARKNLLPGTYYIKCLVAHNCNLLCGNRKLFVANSNYRNANPEPRK